MKDLRRDYGRRRLDDHDLADDPIRQFRAWFEEALGAGIIDANAMSLATASAAGEPSVRTVLLKDVDERGFVRIRPTLQVEGSDRLFAVGDCASLPGAAKAGVYAVRSGPILAGNLIRRVRGQALRAYRPQRGFLSLLNFGDGTAAGAWRGIGFQGRWAMRLAALYAPELDWGYLRSRAVDAGERAALERLQHETR